MSSSTFDANEDHGAPEPTLHEVVPSDQPPPLDVVDESRESSPEFESVPSVPEYQFPSTVSSNESNFQPPPLIPSDGSPIADLSSDQPSIANAEPQADLTAKLSAPDSDEIGVACSSPSDWNAAVESWNNDFSIKESNSGLSHEDGCQASLFKHPSFQPNAKYRAYTKSPSDGNDVRWYFCKAPLGLHEAAASVPAIEIVGKSDYFRFSLRDSFTLEEEFLKREDELVSSWWKEYAECSEGPSKSEKLGDDPSLFKRSSSDFYDEAVGVPVKGGLYEVDLVSRRCFPVYWNGEHRRVLRGYWFAQRGGPDWLPLREDIAEQLEFAYRSKIWQRRSFQPSGQFAARLDFQGATQGLHALFTGEEDTWEAWLNVDATGISSMFGLKGNGFKLRRGFAPSESSQPSQEELHQRKEEEMDDYCSQVPVRHLVFMVHGIGQRLEKANLVDDVGTFRRIVASLAEKYLTTYQRNSHRVLFIPCQWRRHLKLGGEAAVENCTLDGVRALRTMVGATVHDVLYYMSPVYCQDIIDSVSSSLNRLYEKFIRRNPGYDGKISVYGHSLGSVLSYDILCHQEALTSPFPIQEINSNISKENTEEGPVSEDEPVNKGLQEASTAPAADQETLTAEVHSEEPKLEETLEKPELDEKVVEEAASEKDAEAMEVLREEILSLRSKVKELEDRLSSVSSDTKHAEKLQAASSQRHHSPRINYTKLKFEIDTFFAVGSPLGLFLGLRNVRLGTGLGHDYWKDEGIEEEMPACRQMMNIFHPYDPVAYRVEPLISKEYVDKRPVFIPYHKGGKRLHIGMQEFGEDLGAKSRALVSSIASVGTRVANAFYTGDRNNEENNKDEKEERSYGSLVMERLTGSPDGRVDYMLQEATFEHQYISAISSHTNYWRDPDTALFIIRHLYREIPEESPIKVREDEEFKNRILSEFGGYIENETPLTFSCKEGIAAEMAAAEKSCQHRVEPFRFGKPSGANRK